MPLSLTYIAFLILILALMMLPLHITILKNTQKYIHMNYLLYPACSNTEARSPFSLKSQIKQESRQAYCTSDNMTLLCSKISIPYLSPIGHFENIQ